MRVLIAAVFMWGCATELDAPPADETRCSTCTPGAALCDGGDREIVCEDLNDDGCFEWSAARICASGACVDNACVAGCAHECAPDEAVCDVGGRRICHAGEDGCRLVGDLVPCGDDERCDDGACVPNDRPCADACPRDQQSECTADGVRSCGQHDEDPCLEWSVTSPCRAGTACNGGVCMPSCEDACGAGDRSCAGNAVATCADFDGDGCREFGPTTPCADIERCDDGRCVPSEQACEHQCDQEGDTLCDGPSLRRCGDFDGDPCRDLGPAIDCGPAEFCEVGACVPICQDECVDGTARCGEIGEQSCGQHNDDPCLEWGPANRCDEDERCDGGMCVDDEEACDDECERGARRCEDGGVQRCGQHDEDECRDWGPASPCEARQVCDDGDCQEAGPPGQVYINEVLYDAMGTDRPTVFIELWGPPNADLDGFRVVGVNGADGEDYAVIPLQGSTDANGLFVIVHPEAEPALRAVATQIHDKADLQNGPDSVQVRWGNQRLDALGYGTFSGNAVFAGEGEPSRDVRDGRSLSRDRRHIDSDNNAQDFSESEPSPGRE